MEGWVIGSGLGDEPAVCAGIIQEVG